MYDKAQKIVLSFFLPVQKPQQFVLSSILRVGSKEVKALLYNNIYLVDLPSSIAVQHIQ